jgi:hypothetical protein
MNAIAWFAMGALFSLVLCGWPWHHRFSRYSSSSRYRAGEDSNGNCVPMPPAPPPPGMPRKPQPHGGRTVPAEP